jgi:uncharacterized protein (TIGR03083 family)
MADNDIDESALSGLDPYDLFDAEAARIDAFLSSLDEGDEAWGRPSRCEGWTVRDVACHLAATEPYHQACLDGKVAEVFKSYMDRGVTGLDDANELGIRDLDGVGNHEVVERWRSLDVDTRARFRDRDGGEVDSSVGAYPARWQAFHLALELATHADDMGVPVTAAEAADRLAWRTAVSRFTLAEAKGDLEVRYDDDGVRVVLDGAASAPIDDDTFVEAVAARLPAGALDAPVAAALSTLP